ncbi:MAG: UDP-N-acetylmuramoyl-L-alanyl-D-glutamate--2,6-diaminopimelate ligase [Deltaproteobacteria bacterium]|nr:UDP-N-acetylmuramoyl-L-alanyl-D-glutamate--2,6-diaminopimelate ligase [Deltaproteobacteria bacterium]MBW2417039.1 UDP-N-acetylmuramoyl-L-alanyl-D-glutamate--2,6-diaminopimelate ligase [Deltaproteobacteria bacterium]
MRLSALLTSLPPELAAKEWLRPDPADDPVIRGITYDSRGVAPGDLFVALRGSVSDGHDYLDGALRLGAAALLVEEIPPAELIGRSSVVVVPDSRRAMAPIARRFFGEPAGELTLVGITGTNGKTSTSYLVESILARAGMRTGLVGTVEVRYAGEHRPAINTTPESLDLQRVLRTMCNHNVEAMVMEVSSHGLELGRVSGCRFAVAAITNLTQDHLDFHGSMDAYLRSKALLFRDYLAPGAAAVINVDDDSHERFQAAAAESSARVIRTTRDPGREAEVRIVEAEVGISGSRLIAALPSGEIELELPLVGDFNLENLVVALGICEALGIDHESIRTGVAHCPQVPGRMEVIGAEREDLPTVIVDYAHTPDAVDKLLRAVRPLCRGRLVTVFGCGGDRDRAKRPLMAEAVARHSDRILATSDNPRTEDPVAILHDVEAGLASLNRVDPETLDDHEGSYSVVPDRREAIELAVGMARPEDTVVLAGKGHEDYQIIGRDKLPFDDRSEARRVLAAALAEKESK